MVSSTKKVRMRKFLIFTFFLLPSNHQITRHQPASLLTPPTPAACQAPLQPIITILFPSPTLDLLGLQTTETEESQTAGKQISQASAAFQAWKKPAVGVCFAIDLFEFVSLPHFSDGRVWSGLPPSHVLILREQLAPVQRSQWHLGSPGPRHGGLLSCAHGEPKGVLNWSCARVWVLAYGKGVVLWDTGSVHCVRVHWDLEGSFPADPQQRGRCDQC